MDEHGSAITRLASGLVADEAYQQRPNLPSEALRRLGPTDAVLRVLSGLFRNHEAGFGETLFEDRDTVVAPKWLAREEKQRHPKDVVVGGLLLRAFVVADALGAEIVPVLLTGETDARQQFRDRVGLVGFELAAEEKLERLAAVIEQASMPFGEQAADQRRRAVVDLQRPADQKAARLGPSAGVKVGVARLELGIDAALAFALDTKLKRNPSQADAIAAL